MNALFFSFLAGVAAVIQTGLNKNISVQWGLTSALLLNGAIFLAFNVLFFLFMQAQPQLFSATYLLKGSWSDFRWFWVVPGLCGFLLVLGLTYAAGKVGALPAFLTCVAAQIFASMAWDFFIENISVSWTRLVGALLTFAGVYVATR